MDKQMIPYNLEYSYKVTHEGLECKIELFRDDEFITRRIFYTVYELANDTIEMFVKDLKKCSRNVDGMFETEDFRYWRRAFAPYDTLPSFQNMVWKFWIPLKTWTNRLED